MPVFPTVDGRNPAPPGIYKNPVNNGIFIISTGAGFLPSTVVKDLQKMVDSPPCYICLPGMGKPCSVTRKILRVNDLHPTPTQKKTRKLKEKTKFKIPPPKKKKKTTFYFQGSILISTQAPPNSIRLRHSPVERYGVRSHRNVFRFCWEKHQLGKG